MSRESLLKWDYKMYYTYLLKLADGNYYAGSTTNIEKRLISHHKGQNKSTKHLRPVKLIWFGMFSNRKLAEDFEKYLKSSSGFAFRNKRLVE